MILKLNKDLDLKGEVREGEAALYGPKIDIMLKDALGNDRQLGTVQIDFAMPKRFGLTYTDADGTEKAPVMIHRAILGSYGRFIANLLESTGGAFPVWLSPVQVQIIPISDKDLAYANQLNAQFKSSGIRSEVNDKNDRLNAKIRDGEMQKIPYLLVVGDKELENKTVALRKRSIKEQSTILIGEFEKLVLEKISSRSMEL